MKKLKQFSFYIYLLSFLWSCDSDFLDAKPQKSLLVPTSLKDAEALINNSRSVMNVAGYLTLMTDGDFRIDDNNLAFIENILRIKYHWSDEATNWVGDWDYAYKQVFYANVVLQILDQQHNSDQMLLANELRGKALFYRAWGLHLIAQQFAGVYVKEMAASTIGIPYPLSPDVNQTIKRISLEETYSNIFNDLELALNLLPDKSMYSTQPSKVSTNGLMARIYLITGDYEKALEAADKALEINDTLLNYNEISKTLDRPFPLPMINPNPEILYYTIGNSGFTGSANTFADSSLYNIYTNGDLRKELFFNNLRNYKGSYTGSTTPFVGLATDEIYLIKAECLTRLNNLPSARIILSSFLSNRYKTGETPKMEEMNKEELLKFIIMERRRELVGRGTTWMDLRRLNQEPGYERWLTRTINGTIYTLEPGSKNYIMKIPLDEIASSGIEQNP